MNKHEKVILQCANCDTRYKKTLKWLENTHHMVCAKCHTDLDIDEVVNDILSADAPDAVYVVYEK